MILFLLSLLSPHSFIHLQLWKAMNTTVPMMLFSVCFAERHLVSRSIVRNFNQGCDKCVWPWSYDAAPEKWQISFTLNLKFRSSLLLKTNYVFSQHPPASPPFALPPLHPPQHVAWPHLAQREIEDEYKPTKKNAAENLYVRFSVCAPTHVLCYCCRSALITDSCPWGMEWWWLFFAARQADNHLYVKDLHKI